MTEKDLEIQELRREVERIKKENEHIRQNYVSHEVVELIIADNENLKRKYNNCRNELCMKCGYYKCAHIGACDSCKWKERKE